MSVCKLSFGMDMGACVASWFAGLVPDWLAPLLPYWWVVALIGGLGLAYRLAGVPGVAAFSGIVGFIAGRRSVDPRHEHVDGLDAAPSPPKPKRPTIFAKKK